MKKLYSLFAAVVLAATVNAQTTIYSENMGTGASGNPVVATYNGYQNSAPITYGGTADIRTTSASSGYTGASGGNNVFFAATGGRTFIINGINTSTETDPSKLSLTFGWTNSTIANMITVEYSTDGTNYSPLTVTSNANTSWALKTVSGIPSSSTLSLRFTAPASGSGMRIDDVKITTTSTLAVGDVNATKVSFVKNTVVDNNILFAAKSDVKVVSMSGQVVKSASVNENTSLNVADLAKGMYIVTGTVNGKAVSEKIIKK